MDGFFRRNTRHLSDVTPVAICVGRILAAQMKHMPEGGRAGKGRYSWLANRISVVTATSVTSDGLRQFLNAVKIAKEPNSEKRINRANHNLEASYAYIIYDYHRFPPPVQEVFFANRAGLCFSEAPSDPVRDLIAETAIHALGAQSWLDVSPKDMGELAGKLAGRHYVLRKSTISHDEFMKSELEVESHGHGEKRFLSVVHVHQQRSGSITRSQGFVVRVIRNLYALLKVERHEGIEILALREEVTQSPSFFMGFMIGVNSARNVYDSSTLVVPLGSLRDAQEQRHWMELPTRFTEADPHFEWLKQHTALGRLTRAIFRDQDKSRLLPSFDEY